VALLTGVLGMFAWVQRQEAVRLKNEDTAANRRNIARTSFGEPLDANENLGASVLNLSARGATPRLQQGQKPI
jgi:hypothetical protein